MAFRRLLMKKSALTLIAMLSLPACQTEAPAPSPPPAPKAQPKPPPVNEKAKALAKKAGAFFKPLPAFMTADGAAPPKTLTDLGRVLYFEKRLSKNHDVSCNSCHDVNTYGVDNEPTSDGHKGQKGDRNSPTSFNAALHITQFWDGRAADVEEQAKGPVLNPVEMAMASEEAVVAVLKSIPGYADLFKAAFPGEEDAITYDNMAKAIGAFERGLVTPSPFDAFLKGDLKALSPEQQAGLETYLDVGCATCHAGVALGGSGYFKLGQVVPYELTDEGRFKVTGNEADKFHFKNPGLRNVAETAPYYHDGSIATLEEAANLMAKHQLGKDLTPEQTAQILAFLKSLTGEVDAQYVAEPDMPASGPQTPAADPS